MANRSSEIPTISIIVTRIGHDYSITYQMAESNSGRAYTFTPMMPSCRRVCQSMEVDRKYIVHQLRAVQGTMWESARLVPGRLRIVPANDAITRSVAARKSLQKAPEVDPEALLGISFEDPVGDASKAREKMLVMWRKHRDHLVEWYLARHPDMPEKDLLVILKQAKDTWESRTPK